MHIGEEGVCHCHCGLETSQSGGTTRMARWVLLLHSYGRKEGVADLQVGYAARLPHKKRHPPFGRRRARQHLRDSPRNTDTHAHRHGHTRASMYTSAPAPTTVRVVGHVLNMPACLSATQAAANVRVHRTGDGQGPGTPHPDRPACPPRTIHTTSGMH